MNIELASIPFLLAHPAVGGDVAATFSATAVCVVETADVFPAERTDRSLVCAQKDKVEIDLIFRHAAVVGSLLLNAAADRPPRLCAMGLPDQGEEIF